MPPAGMPQPTVAERNLLVSWTESALSKTDCKLPDPGRVTLHRLNRVEYNNTIRDLVGLDLKPADDFPSDDVGYGFDNIGDVLSISPLLMEKYLTAAERVAEAAIVTPESGNRPVRFEEAALANAGGQRFEGTGGRILSSEGEVGVDYEFPATGEYRFRTGAFGQQAGPESARMTFRLDHHDLQTVAVRAVEDAPGTYDVRTKVFDGKRRVSVAFINDYYNTDSPDPKMRGDRNLVVNWLEIEGPLDVPGIHGPLPASHKRIFFTQPTGTADREACARRILASFARRAYRRPASPDEIGRLTRYAASAWKGGSSFERGIQVAAEAVLVSPNFLFRVEKDAHPNEPRASHLLNDYELATRLSYFLWSSMPDETLFRLAAKGALHKPEVLVAQAKRMLKDPKARALADNFAGQWLQLRKLARVSPDVRTFPTFNETLRTAMRTETEMFFESIVQEDRSILDFLDAKYTFLNEPLARHYGNTAVTGNQFRRVVLTGDQRGGLLTQASILTVTSNPTRTSPVKRGKWIMEDILGTPIPPPPPGVGQLPDDKKNKGPLVGTLRQRLEQHRKNPACASCHQRMDPLGFALENYNAIGEWRTRDGDFPIDASGVLPDGRSFVGARQLKGILLAKKAQFVRNLSEKMLTYALGRGVESYDRCNIDTMMKTIAARDYRFSALVTAVVESDAFRKRRGDAPRPAVAARTAQNAQ